MSESTPTVAAPFCESFFSGRALFKIAVGLWIASASVIGMLVAWNPMHHSVTWPYYFASESWWMGGRIYIGPLGMNYLPHFAIIFSVFDVIPRPYGEILWHFLAAFLIASGLWRLCRRTFGNYAYEGLFWTTLLCLPLSLAALRNGQANGVFAGVILHGIASLASRKWWQAAGLIALSVAIKPLGIVLVLLAPVVYRPLRWRMALAVAGLLVFPFLFARPGYVLAQYHAFAINLQSCSLMSDHSYADIGGVFRTFGIELPPLVSKTIRALAGGVTLGLWWWGGRRLGEPLRALWLHALAASYLMVFNPMNESNGYVIIAPAFALWGVYLLRSEEFRQLGWGVAFIPVSIGVLTSLLRPWLGSEYPLFWNPLMTLLFMALLISYVREVSPSESPSQTA